MSEPLKITEQSESDAITTYVVSERLYVGFTTAGVRVEIAESPVYGRMLFLDGELQSASADEHIYHETLVHPAVAAAATDKPRNALRVLVVGGGEGATVREVLRWFPARVDWVDYDADLVEICRKYLRWAPFVYEHPDVRFIAADIREALSDLEPEYDVIILDLPDPDGETGYLYSSEFWQDMSSRLASRGILVTHCGPVRPYGGIGEGYKRVSAAFGSTAGFYHTLIPSFQGEWGFWMWKKGGGTFAYILDPYYDICKEENNGKGCGVPLPLNLRVIDDRQLCELAELSKVWQDAISDS